MLAESWKWERQYLYSGGESDCDANALLERWQLNVSECAFFESQLPCQEMAIELKLKYRQHHLPPPLPDINMSTLVKKKRNLLNKFYQTYRNLPYYTKHILKENAFKKVITKKIEISLLKNGMGSCCCISKGLQWLVPYESYSQLCRRRCGEVLAMGQYSLL